MSEREGFSLELGGWGPRAGFRGGRRAASKAKTKDLAAAVWEKKPVEGFVCIEVEDEGPGVPEEQKSKVFDPYQTSRAKGMGLGLSIVKGIADAHGGTVFEAGEEGKGARFVILLPIRTGAESGRR